MTDSNTLYTQHIWLVCYVDKITSQLLIMPKIKMSKIRVKNIKNIKFEFVN
jgi:hypothetical protein